MNTYYELENITGILQNVEIVVVRDTRNKFQSMMIHGYNSENKEFEIKIAGHLDVTVRTED